MTVALPSLPARDALNDTFDHPRSAYTLKFATWLIDTVDWSAEDFSASQDIIDDVVERMNSALVDQLGKLAEADAAELRNPLTRANESDHLLCSLCIIVLDQHDRANDAMNAAIVALAQRIVLSLDFASPIVARIAQAVLENVLRAGADALWKSSFNPAAIAFVRFIGAECPDWEDHPEGAIFELCVAPLLKAGLLEIEMEEFKIHFGPGTR